MASRTIDISCKKSKQKCTKFMLIKSTFPKPLHSCSNFLCFLFINLLNEFVNSDLRLFCTMYSNIGYWQSSVFSRRAFTGTIVDGHALTILVLFRLALDLLRQIPCREHMS